MDTIQRLSFSAKIKKTSQEKIIFALSFLFFSIFSFTINGFLTLDNMVEIVRSISTLGILSMGLLIVVIGKGIDLSIISTMAITVGFSLSMMIGGFNQITSISAGLLFAMVIGFVNGFGIAYVEIPAIFLTLATSILVFGLGCGPLKISTLTIVPDNAILLQMIGAGDLFGIPKPIVVFLFTWIIVHLFLNYTKYGVFIFAQGDNIESARLSGVPVRVMILFEYMLSGVIAFVAGLVMAGTVGAMPTQVVKGTLIFDVILVVVLGGASLNGGIGSAWSVAAGVMFVGILLNGMTVLNLDPNFQNIIKSLVLLSAIAIDNYLHPRNEDTDRQGDI